MKEYLIAENPNPDRPHNQRLYKFPNNYGASVVWSNGGGLLVRGSETHPYELAVLKFYSENAYYLDYETSITNDVIGYQNEEQITDLLIRIKNLEGDVNESVS
jgi:hypothetical protein